MKKPAFLLECKYMVRSGKVILENVLGAAGAGAEKAAVELIRIFGQKDRPEVWSNSV